MKGLIFAVGVVVLMGITAAIAQTISVPIVPTIAPGLDLVQVIPQGAPKMGNQYTTPGAIAGVSNYVSGGTILTSAAFTYAHQQENYFAHAAGTLALVTPTTEANPSDGQRECFYMDAIATSLAWTANTGQTINSNVHSAGAAFIPNCITYVAASATWFSSP